MPLDDFDAILIGIAEKEAIRTRNGSGLFQGDSLSAKVETSLLDISNPKGKVTGTDGVGTVLEQQMQLLIP